MALVRLLAKKTKQPLHQAIRNALYSYCHVLVGPDLPTKSSPKWKKP
jgi:hypothetical protein